MKLSKEELGLYRAIYRVNRKNNASYDVSRRVAKMAVESKRFERAITPVCWLFDKFAP